MCWTTTVSEVPVKEVHECESWLGVGVDEEEEKVEEAVSWAWELLCFSPSLAVNWKSAGGSPSESAQAQRSLLLENTNKISTVKTSTPHLCAVCVMYV